MDGGNYIHRNIIAEEWLALDQYSARSVVIVIGRRPKRNPDVSKFMSVIFLKSRL